MYVKVGRDTFTELGRGRRLGFHWRLSEEIGRNKERRANPPNQTQLDIQHSSRSNPPALLHAASQRLGRSRQPIGRRHGACSATGEGETMMWNKDEVEGKIDQAKGKAKQAVGDVTNNEDLKAEGEVDEAAGKVQDTVGRGTRKVGEAIEDVGRAVKRG
jgi:uncharacterized protein YjbJ (UPF0337 family)